MTARAGGERPEPTPLRYRTPVSMIEGSRGGMTVLCDDGTVWGSYGKFVGEQVWKWVGWRKLPPIPGTRAHHEERGDDGPF